MVQVRAQRRAGASFSQGDRWKMLMRIYMAVMRCRLVPDAQSANGVASFAAMHAMSA
jgi:hypothetical protein